MSPPDDFPPPMMSAAPMYDAALDTLRTPPHSVEAEQSVLGGLMLENAAWERIADRIRESDYYRADHRLIWQHISQLIEHNRPADVITVAESLERSAQLDNAGGLAYLAGLAQNVPSAANIHRYAEIVRERSIMRSLAEIGTAIADSAYSPRGRDAAALLDEAEAKVFDIAEQGSRGKQGFERVGEVLKQVVERIEELYNRDNPDDVTGVATGYTDLDERTSGLQPGDLIIVAGRPSMGKTALALNFAEHVALGSKKPVAVFSMEMGATQLVMRLIGSIGRLDQHRLRTGRLTKEDWNALSDAIAKLSDAPMHIDETPALTALEVRARARRLHREHKGLGLIVIDYLQLMSSTSQGENRATEISEISRSLKALAKELQVPVVALSQLNRSLEQRPNKRPVMSDLRECVVGDTRVLLTDGRRVPIRELVGTQPEVWAVDAERKVVAAKADLVWHVGVKPVFDLCLASGRTLRATAEHRVLTGAGWKRVGEIGVGERVGVCLPAAVVKEESAVLVSLAAGVRSDALERQLDARLNAGESTEVGWDEVLRVRSAGDVNVYDLTVPGPECWLADGIVTHNSGAIEQDADVILFIYRDEVYNPETPERGIAEVIIGKQRNGPIGTVKLTFRGENTRFENYADASRFS